MSLKLFHPDDLFRTGGVTPPRSPLENELLAAALLEFDCEPLPPGYGSGERRRRERKRAKVADTTSRFVAAIRSDSPPATEAEAIALLAPIGAWLLSWLIRQLVIQVIKFLWRTMHESPSGD